MSGTNGNGTNGSQKPLNGNGHPGAGRPKGTTRVETDQEFRENLLIALTEFESKSAACAQVGISYKTLKRWLDIAWQAESGFWANFWVAYMRARTGWWEQATGRLSNRNPEILLSNECGDEWNVAKKLEVTVGIGDPFELLKDEEATDALDRAIARRQASRPMA